ncbi:MAG: di-heme enzyme [Phycisphaerales bacterium]|nr:di-heme enzyme [Phycisphaerales bacterium]
MNDRSTSNRGNRLFYAGLLAFLPGACVPAPMPGDGTEPPPSTYEFRLPQGFPTPVVPDDNPMTDEKIELGRHLFYDTRLSGNGLQACASCHIPEHGFAEPRTTAVGSTGQVTARNAPGLANAAYYSTYTWSSKLLLRFEQQMLIPMFGEDPIEMGITGNEDVVLERIRDDDRYTTLFAAAFPDDAGAFDFDHIVKAIACFLRTMIAGDSRWHRAIYQGEDAALGDAARRGAELFFSERLECHHCHGGFHFTQATRHDGTVFQEGSFHNIGLYNVNDEGGYPPSDTGLLKFTGDPNDMGKFRAPSLQNVAATAPYFHDGSAATLRDVIAVYEAGGRLLESGPNAGDGRTNPLKSGFIRGFTLTDSERDDLIAFLESLTDDRFLSDPRFGNPFEQEP